MATRNKANRVKNGYEGMPTALDFRFTGVRAGAGSDSIDIHLQSIPRRLSAKPVAIGKDTLRKMGEELVRGLEDHWIKNSFISLKQLANMGYEAFKILTSQNGPAQQKRWKDLLDAPNDVRHAVTRIEFESDLSFPVGLLCTSNPSTNNYRILAEKFVGARSVIINTLGLIQDRQDDSTFICDRRPCLVAHAVDTGVPGVARESEFLSSLQGVKTQQCLNRNDLLKQWNNVDTGVIHFSCHHLFDQAVGQYVLTLSNGDTFRALADRPNLIRADRHLPFLFMNGCNTGSIFAGKPDTFIRSLCPTYSAGVLSTIHSIGGNHAAIFARRYYENWVQGEFAVDALSKTKYSFIFKDEEFSAITYEFWEMPEVLRLFKD